MSSFNFIKYQHFTPVFGETQALELFASSIKMLEIEVFSYCNRKCWFCPNTEIDRQSKNIYMDEKLYLRILQQLATIKYKNVISYSRYNEPLADRVILTRLRQARELLPDAKLHTNTNGDYINATYIEELFKHGLNSLKIQVYLNKDEKFEDDIVLEKLIKKASMIGLPYKIVESKKGLRHEAKIEYPGMNISIYARNFERDGCSRGNLVDLRRSYQRSSPCLSPFRNLYIDYTGKVMPCCNLRSDAPEHGAYIIGDANTQSLFQIYTTGSLVKWRKRLFDFGPKPIPCNNCSFSLQKKNLSYLIATSRIYMGKMSDLKRKRDPQRPIDSEM